MQLRRLPRAFYQVARLTAADLSPKAQERSRWLYTWQVLRTKGLSSAQAGEVLSIPRSTLYRWHRRLQRQGPRGLEPRSRRPRRHRQPTWSPELAQEALSLRERYPRWGKEKLAILLRQQGWQISVSMVGRILTSLKRRGLLREPLYAPVSARKRRHKRPYATRKPKEYQAKAPGDLVEVDTMDLRPLPGVALKQFTARDVISRWDVLEVRTRATATTAREFLDTLKERLPYPLRAIQVDGGSEFMAGFEIACQEAGIRLFVLPPHSPKLNGHVERANRTHTEEFWECYDGDLELAVVQPALLAWEKTYNTVRPHHSLKGRTPAQYIRERHPEFIPQLSHMY